MQTPERFTKLLNMIDEQLFYNSDNIVVLDQDEWEKQELTKADVQRGISYLEEKGFILKQKVWDTWKEEKGEVSHEDRVFMLENDDILKQEVNPIYYKDLKFQVVLLMTDGFKKFYEDIRNPKENTTGTEKAGSAPKEITFDREKSAIEIEDTEVQISLKNDKSNAHYVLEYIFENPEGLKEKSFYSEILEKKFQFQEDKKWNTIYRACDDINNKVLKQASISDFLDRTSGKTGWVRINPKYL